MSPQSVREYAASLRPRYLLASRAEKTRLLTEFSRLAGRHRKSAIRLLRHPSGQSILRPGRPPSYGPEVTALLRVVWEASDYLSYQRLLASGVLSEAQQQALATIYRGLNPVALRAQIQETLRRLWQLADRSRGTETPCGPQHTTGALEPSPTEARRATSRRGDKISIPPRVRSSEETLPTRAINSPGARGRGKDNNSR